VPFRRRRRSPVSSNGQMRPEGFWGEQPDPAVFPCPSSAVHLQHPRNRLTYVSPSALKGLSGGAPPGARVSFMRKLVGKRARRISRDRRASVPNIKRCKRAMALPRPCAVDDPIRVNRPVVTGLHPPRDLRRYSLCNRSIAKHTMIAARSTASITHGRSYSLEICFPHGQPVFAAPRRTCRAAYPIWSSSCRGGR